MMIKSTCLETIKFHKNILASEDREFIKKEKEKQQQWFSTRSMPFYGEYIQKSVQRNNEAFIFIKRICIRYTNTNINSL